jgi:sensor domain CHASE-containing protein
MNAELTKSIFIATLPLLIVLISILGSIIWNLIEIKALRQEVRELTKKVSELAERVSRLEGKLDGKVILK